MACVLALASLLGAQGFTMRPRVVVAPRMATISRVRSVTLSTEVSEQPGSMSTYTEQGKELPLAAKERLFIESIACFYNDERPLLSNDDYERLKLDLEFEASKYVTMSAEELKFVIASSRYREGKPIMADDAYDALRKKLKALNSMAVIHEAPTCTIDTGVCKSDATPDEGKNAILYAPGTIAATVLWTEALYWTKRMDPFIAAVLGAPIIYLVARLITERILFQKPLVVSTTCPNCQSVVNLYFGDVLGVDNENIMATTHECPVCKTTLKGNRETMVVETVPKK